MNNTQEILTKPKFSDEQAETIAREHFRVVGTATELAGERDQNFLLTHEQTRHVLKIANPNSDLQVLELENAAMGIVATLDSPESPTLQRSVTGSTIATISDSQGKSCFARVLSFVPGLPLAEFRPHSRELLIALGRVLGEIDIELASLNFNQAARRNLKWDLQHGPAIVADSLSLFAEDTKKSQLLRLFLKWHERISDRLDGLPKSVIHNDANDYNVLVEQDRHGLAVLGLIDFGDIVYSTTTNELAICIAYTMLDKSNPIEAAQALTVGYNQTRRLSEDELSVLFPLACMRLAQSVSLSASQQKLRPSDQYLSISQCPAWEMLYQLAALDPQRVHAELSNACSAAPRPCLLPNTGSPTPMEATQILDLRRHYVAPSIRLAYDRPLHIVRGKGQYLFDQAGVTYLDCVNNVCHVGHCHPKVVRAAAQQMEVLNTNTRYLHENIVSYAKRLVETLPPPLEVCFFVNSGSEANDLALRLARARTGRNDVVVINHAYHGHTSAMIEISPYKFASRGGTGKPDHVHILDCPDGYRGTHSYDDSDYGAKYVLDATKKIRDTVNSGRSIAAFFAESLLGCGGQIQLPAGYLAGIYAEIRELGGVCVADEVQVGFGRVGSHFWGFQQQDVVPDIVTLGKPIGNGHPLAAVVTTREIAAAFDNGMEYFNTFGGNPVSSAVGLAVLDVIEQQDLQNHALQTGNFLLTGLKQLQDKFPQIGDVRGSGLFLGIELVEDRDSLKPATNFSHRFVQQMKDRRILLSTDGPNENVIKFKPPMVFNLADAERLITTMEREFQCLQKT